MHKHPGAHLLTKRSIGIYGGTFDPVHLTHIAIAKTARKILSLDSVLFIPTNCSPHKAVSATTADDRLKMLRLALDAEDNLYVDDQELTRPAPSYTIDTINQLMETHPEAKLFLIIGADQYQQFSHWHRAQEILTRVTLIVVPRPNHPSPSLVASKSLCSADTKGKAMRLTVTESPVSASFIRGKLLNNQSVEDYLHPKVIDYIRAHNLYVP